MNDLKRIIYLFTITLVISACSNLSEFDKIRIANGNNLEFLYATNTNDSIVYVAETEITNAQFKQYLNSVRHSNPSEYSSNYPDSLGWYDSTIHKLEKSFMTHMSLEYFSNEAYNNYPVVCITKQAAMDYVNWLNLIEPDTLVTYRICNDFDWFAIQDTGVSYAWRGSGYLNGSSMPLGNFAIISQGSITLDYVSKTIQQSHLSDLQLYLQGPVAVNSYHPNDQGVYCISGNVAEMILGRDYTRGGSWGSLLHYLRIHSYEYYSLPSPFVGFRVTKIKRHANNG